jgi:hypothetical protein
VLSRFQPLPIKRWWTSFFQPSNYEYISLGLDLSIPVSLIFQPQVLRLLGATLPCLLNLLLLVLVQPYFTPFLNKLAILDTILLAACLCCGIMADGNEEQATFIALGVAFTGIVLVRLVLGLAFCLVVGCRLGRS